MPINHTRRLVSDVLLRILTILPLPCQQVAALAVQLVSKIFSC